MDLTVVIPAFNEADRLPARLPLIVAQVIAMEMQSEIVVVDDGSRDQTAQRVSEFATTSAVPVVVTRHHRNRGKGAAVRRGLAMSRGAWVLICDADLATPIEELPKLWAAVDPRTIAIGSRAIDRRLLERRQPWYRDLMGRGFNLLVRLSAISDLHDTQCGFKLFPGEVARALAFIQRVDGFAYDVELLAVARAWGLTIREIPVRWRHVEDSRVHPIRHSLQMARDLVGVAVRLRLGRTPPCPAELGP
jgi:dolichyl-phosphate beta-glucosyltransferase